MEYTTLCRTMLGLLTLSSCTGETITDVMDLHETLFVNSKYNRNIRGIADQTEVVRVGANFSLITVGEVMEKEEAFSVMGLLYLSWKDERLVWDPNDYNGTKLIVVYQDMVWKPEVKLANPLLSVIALGLERAQIRVSNTGQVNWLIADMYTATCNIDVISFPWDRQFCSLDFVVSTYLPSEVLIEPDSDQIGYFQFDDSESWDVVKTVVESKVDVVSKVIFGMCLDRRPSFHLAVVLVPILALSLLNVFAFFVKVDSGERISFAITLLLSITLYLSLISSKLPSHSKGMSAIIYLLNLVLSESMFICIMSIFSMYVYHKRGTPSLTWQRIVLKMSGRKFNRDLYTKGSVDVKTFTENAGNGNDVVYDKAEDIGNAAEKDLGITWMDVSQLMDRSFSLLSSIAIFCCFATFAAFVVSKRTECM